MKKEIIRIEGVREHNLQNLSLSIPRGEFTVVTGVSGSGKSTLIQSLIGLSDYDGDILINNINKLVTQHKTNYLIVN